MKRSFIILLIMLSLTGFAQEKQKIALLEPLVGEGSTSVTGMEKAMVRGELRKAMVNFAGFEAITRTDIDQMMKEQDFQRTGMVSDDQIKKLGEMSGADYICVSTLTKSNTEFYLEAYLIHLESGTVSNPAAQYGELEYGKLANMLPVCQNLARELLGEQYASSNSSSTSVQNDDNAVLRKGILWLDEGKYIGEIKNRKPHGKGILKYKVSDEDLRKSYEGEWIDGKMNGKGVMEWYGPSKYVGNWKDGEEHGQGTLYYKDFWIKDGITLEGNWEHGSLNYGTCFYSDGSKYVGRFEYLKKQGQGTYYKDGNRYEGSWDKDKRNGYFTIYWQNGDKDTGYYVNDEPDGEFKRTSPDGKIKTATYSNGKIVQDWH